MTRRQYKSTRLELDGTLTALETLVTGELLAGVRTHDDPASTPLIHNSWNVEWAATEPTKAKMTAGEKYILTLIPNP